MAGSHSELCPSPASDGESFYSTLPLQDEGPYAQVKDGAHEEVPCAEGANIHITESGENQTNLGGQDAHRRHRSPTKTAAKGQPSSRTSSASPRKRRRSGIPTGPKAPIPRRRSSVPIRRKGQDLIAFHRQSCRLFQSLEGTLATSDESTMRGTPPQSRPGSLPNSRPSSHCIVKTENGFAYLTSNSSMPRFGSANNSRRNSSTTAPPLLRPLYGVPGLSSSTAPTTSSSFSSLVGASTSNGVLEEKSSTSSPSAQPTRPPRPGFSISWTSTETRRLEYKKIDRSHSGLRGLWKRLTPKWCHGKCSRKGFFVSGKSRSSDAGSVRRYRIPLEEDDDGSNDDEVENEKRGNIARREKPEGRKWSCLSLLRGK
jgi:hypothetical protein